jgi:ferritin-like metal-binding protein YciE
MGGKGTFGPGTGWNATPVGELDGVWQVERTGGVLPPMTRVRKRIRGTRGETIVGPVRMRFRVNGRELRYDPPFVGLVDVLEPGADGWTGRATWFGRPFGTFRLRRIDVQTELEDQLVKHIDEALAMEQSVLRLLDSMIATTEDPEIKDALREHHLETERHVDRMQARLEAHGASPSMVREAGGILGALLKGLVDATRSEKAGRNARDGYATEHMEIAAYELLERIAQRAGDEETALAARENKADEQKMAKVIETNWDRFVELSLQEVGVAV